MLSQCPITTDFDPLSADYMADPFPIFAELRSEAPVTYVPRLNIHVVTRYEDVSRVLLDREGFSSLQATSPFLPVCEEAQAILASGFPRKPTFTNCDAPRHPKMRNAASRCMTTRRWASVEPPIRAYAEQLVTALAAKPVADIRADLAFPLPAFAAFTLLGFPMADIELLKSWCGRRVALTYGDLPPEGQVEAARDLVAFWDYCRSFVESRKAAPADDLTSDLLALSETRGDELTTEDIVNMVYSMSLASHETSTSALMNGLQVLLADRGQWDALCADRSLVPGAVEEMMRFSSPTMALRRTATCDTEVGGVPIPKGARMFLVLASANRDSAHFPDADTLDIRRQNAGDHLSFGKAWHLCLGAPLARIELNAALELLTEKTPGMRLVEDQDYTYEANILIRAADHLQVRPTPGA
jgi:cytochrome P450